MYVLESITSVTSLTGWQSSRAAARGRMFLPNVLDGISMCVYCCLQQSQANKSATWRFRRSVCGTMCEQSKGPQDSDLVCKDVSNADQGSANWWSSAVCCAVRTLLTPTTFFAAWLAASVTAPATSTVTSLFPNAVAAEIVLSVLDDSFESLCSATTSVLSYPAHTTGMEWWETTVSTAIRTTA